MASPALEVAGTDIDVVGVPGVTAALAASGLLGAPLGHDHASISLSRPAHPVGGDRGAGAGRRRGRPRRHLLQPAQPRPGLAAAQGASRCCSSTGRRPPRSASSPTPPARARPVLLTTLGELDLERVTMLACVVVGSSQSTVVGGRFVTPRGYRWSPGDYLVTDACTACGACLLTCPEHAIVPTLPLHRARRPLHRLRRVRRGLPRRRGGRQVRGRDARHRRAGRGRPRRPRAAHAAGRPAARRGRRRARRPAGRPRRSWRTSRAGAEVVDVGKTSWTGTAPRQEEINAQLVAHAQAGQAGGAAQGRRPVRVRPRQRGGRGARRRRRPVRGRARHHAARSPPPPTPASRSPPAATPRTSASSPATSTPTTRPAGCAGRRWPPAPARWSSSWATTGCRCSWPGWSGTAAPPTPRPPASSRAPRRSSGSW